MKRVPFRLRLKRLERAPRTPWRPRQIPTRILPIALVLIAVAAWIYYRVQAGQIEAARIPGDAQAELEVTKMRLDAIRSTLTVAAGLGGAAALVLGFRKQQHEEFHTTQQRIMDLRVHAVEQLTSENATVRKNGLLTLERLGEQHEELRSSVLDEICTYLRQPFDPDDHPGSTDPEREVRRKAQEILQRKLKRTLGPREYWSHDRLDLSGAHLERVDFGDCHLVAANFFSAVFAGDASFIESSFNGYTTFLATKFEGSAEFNHSTFLSGADFKFAEFGDIAFFSRAGFGSAAEFQHAIFRSPVDFEQTSFLSEFNAHGTRFNADTGFEHALFRERAAFHEVVFSGTAAFEFTKFRGDARFDATVFERRATILSSTFEKDAHFQGTDFRGPTTFWGSTFNGDANFEGTALHEPDIFDLVSFWRPLNPSQLPTGWNLEKLPSPSRYRYLVREPEPAAGPVPAADQPEPVATRERG
ncbi:pentapeptide repeat-containing protein [Glycomyces dulcitolivorans]|uniref:pentapeptide repeat-containing protein n=1 Tax=Glycomyces dulcitolivorans TaxID=2200759 RepID=UPI001E50BF0A|nr:pentapeptide repeat-containing protein [Glycomyces dulcitolivorans]